MATDKAPCASSRKMVIGYCPVCGACPLEESGCSSEEEEAEATRRERLIIMKHSEDLPKAISGDFHVQRLALVLATGGMALAGLVLLSTRGLTRWRRRYKRSSRSLHDIVLYQAGDQDSGSEDGNI